MASGRGPRCSALAALLAVAACGQERAPRRPNILLIYSDDQRYDSLGITGNPYIETPNLDRIARQGILFERAYVTTSRCCPARASMLTGVHATAHGVWNNHPEHDFLAERESVADYLDRAGYDTAWIGKWHLPNPGARPVRGFDHWVSYEGPGNHFDQTFNVDGQEVSSEGYQADRLTDYAREFLARERDAPFFLVLAFKNPHVPMTPAPRHEGLLDEVQIPPPESAFDPVRGLPAFYQRLRVADGRHAIVDREAYQRDVRRYWELVLSIDDNVGRVLALLEDSGELDHTLVVVTTDNGQLLGEHGLQQKGLSYEPSIRVPLAMRYPPAIPEHSRSDRIALNVDLLPTLLDLARVEVDARFHGRSLAPLWSGEVSDWREDFLYLAPDFGGETGMFERAIVGERWKYVRFQTEGVTEELLFDRQADPDERRNAAGDPAAAPALRRLRAKLVEELARLGDH